METKKKLGFYSLQAADLWGTHVWRHVDGHNIHVTGVVSDEKDYNWSDKVCVGEVTHAIRKGFSGKFSDMDDMFDEFFDQDYEDSEVCELCGSAKHLTGECPLNEYEPEWIDPYDDPFYSENNW